MHIILQTPRLYLRRFNLNDEDASLIFKLNGHTEVLKYLHERSLTDIADAKNVIESIILPQYKNNLGRWAVHLKDSNDFVGWCGLKYRQERDETDLGYRFLPEVWGKGIASEAAAACLNYAFETLQLQQVNACAHKENAASLRILQKIGMTYTHDEIIDECPVKCFIITTLENIPKKR